MSESPPPPASRPPLGGLRALDLTDGLGALCGKILSDLGVEVARVEPPGGSVLRRRPPLAEGVAAPEAGLGWWVHAAGCRSLVLDLDTAGGRERLLALAGAADFVIESFAPGHLDRLGIGWAALHAANPRLVLTSITPFGQGGPWAGWRGPELVVQALSGMMNLLGDPDRPPVRLGGEQADLQAGGQAAVGTLVAHHLRTRTGRGQRVEVSAQHAMIWTMLSETGLPPLHGYDATRDGPNVRSTSFRRRVIFPCRDGHVAISISGGVLGVAMMRALTAWMHEEGRAPASMRERDWRAWDNAYLLSMGERGQQEIDEVADAVTAFTLTRTRAELYEGALARSLLLAPVFDMDDVLASPQLAARGFLVETPEPRLGRPVRRPGAWARLSRTPLRPPAPAPALDADAEHVSQHWRPRPTEIPSSYDAPPMPLAGLRVIDFAWVATGPLTGRLLAEFGADVIRVESAGRLDPGRTLAPWADGKAGPNRSQFFANYNAGKRSVTLDLGRLEGQELARRLVAAADAVVESFTPGTMARWGLDYASLSRSRPDLVYLSSCQQGQTGPHAHYRGYGSLAAGLAGFYAVTGWPDRAPPMIYGAYTDFVAHHFASAALLAALDLRRRTGQGQHVDLSQLEASLHFLGPEILERTVNGWSPGRRGNTHPWSAPHGVYPCAGADRWCAIVCESEADWDALRRAMGEPAWAREERFAAAAGRKAHEAALDRHLGAWTAPQEAHALMATLQAAGVPAGVVQTCADLQRDPALAARQALAWIEHAEMGRTPHETWAFRGPVPARLRPAPCLGEHTDEVLREVLGLSLGEIRRLREDGVLV